ncbi:MAG: hypothetical protein ACI89S_002051, partial [Gammaproteobacteria bacterium]
WPLDHMASSSCANSPPAYASYDVFVHQLAVLRPASSRPDLTVKPLPFASSYRLITTWFSTVIFLQGTFTPLVHAHAGRNKHLQPDILPAARKTPLM